jgi:peptidoglycan/xylan/chitin deacetylase (PgdA/CDA1 family)
MYHSVCGGSASRAFAPFVLPPAILDAHLGALADDGWSMGSISDLWMSPPDAKVVALTFDDGFRDFYDEVVPRLRQHGARASLFVPTGYVGGTARWLAPEGEDSRPILDWSQLEDIAQSGLIEIGAHSHAHPQLDMIDIARATAEIRLPRRILEDNLQTAVPTFAYPFGYFNRSVLRRVREAGYELACAVGERHATTRDDRLALPRWSVGPTVSASGLLDLVRFEPTRLGRLSSEGKRYAWRSARRFRPGPIAPPVPLGPVVTRPRTSPC